MPFIFGSEAEVLEELHENAVLHAERSNDLFIVDDFEPKKLPGYMTLHTRGNDNNRRSIGNRLPGVQLESFADFIDERYKTIGRTILDPDHILAFDHMGQFLKNNYSVTLAQSHGEATDIAFDLGFKSVRLAEQGVEHDTAIILSKAFDFLKVNTRKFNLPFDTMKTILSGIGISLEGDGTIPLRSFLGIVANRTYFVIPASSTFEDMRKKERKLIGDFNESSIELIAQDLTEGTVKHGDKSSDTSIRGTLLASALTGTTTKDLDVQVYLSGIEKIPDLYKTYPGDIPVDSGESLKVIGSISPRVYDYLKFGVTFASGIVLDEEKSRQDIRPDFIITRDESDIPTVGEKIIDSLSRLHPGEIFIQDINRNLPTIRTEKTN